MSDAKNPFEQMMALGQDWAKSVNPDLSAFSGAETFKGFEDLWPTMSRDAMEAFMGKGVSPDGLDAKTRLLLTLMGLTVQGAQAESQIRLTVRHAVAAGATSQEIAETIAQAALFGGVPAMTKAMDIATAVMEKEDKS